MKNNRLSNEEVAYWHDESLLNRYMVDYMKTNNPLILLPEYAIPQENAFAAQELKPYMKMILLDKKGYGGKDWLRTIK